MRYGLGLASAGKCGDARSLAVFAGLAETAGWDGIFLEDHLIHWYSPNALTYDPWIALTAMALRTERILLGLTVTPLARRRPWKLARETVTLDRLSNGRLILGVGVGNGTDPDFAQLGEVTDPRCRARMLDEALDVLVGLWSGRTFSYRGEHYQVYGARFLPTPIQYPRIPIWIGGGWPLKGPVHRAARWDGACLYKVRKDGSWADMTAVDVRALKDFVARQRAVDTPYDIVVGGRARASDWDCEREHIQAVAEAGATWWIEHVPPDEPEVMRAAIARGPLRVD